jgi:hypothetical protein
MRFFGVVGYGESSETLPGSGIWEDVITEVNCTGDILRDVGNPEPGENISNDLRVNNSISVVADAIAVNHFHNIKYIMWQGVRWTVDSVEVRPPRLLLTLGGVYNGPTPTP